MSSGAVERDAPATRSSPSAIRSPTSSGQPPRLLGGHVMPHSPWPEPPRLAGEGREVGVDHVDGGHRPGQYGASGVRALVQRVSRRR